MSTILDQAITGPTLGRRNALINGSFSIAQRGTSLTTDGMTLDRWWLRSFSLSGGTVRTVAAYNSNGPYLYAEVAGMTGSTYYMQKVEGVATFEGKTVTLSYEAFHSVDAYAQIIFIQDFGTGGTPDARVETATPVQAVKATGTWDPVTFTADLPSIAGKVLGSSGNDCLHVYVMLTNATGDGPPTDGVYRFRRVQLEEGSTATPFEYRPQGEELALCQRYYELSGIAQHRYTEQPTQKDYFFATPKRIRPTVSFVENAPGFVVNRAGESWVTLTSATTTGNYRLAIDAEL